jgi:hypothetical protein
LVAMAEDAGCGASREVAGMSPGKDGPAAKSPLQDRFAAVAAAAAAVVVVAGSELCPLKRAGGVEELVAVYLQGRGFGNAWGSNWMKS